MTALAPALLPARLTLRLHRFELIAFMALAALGTGLAYLIAGRLDAIGYGRDCVAAMQLDAAPPLACQARANEFYELAGGPGGLVMALLLAVPLLGGLVIGVPVVGREIDRGTTRLAWALGPSRQRWFLQRLIPVLVIVAVVSFVIGTAADRLFAASNPEIDAANAFGALGFRGVGLAGRAVFVLALGVLVGALLGRPLPGVIVGVILASVGLFGGAQVHQEILKSEAVELDEADGRPGDLYFDQMFRLADGSLIGWEDVERYDPPPSDPEFTGEWPTLPSVVIGVPGERYREVELREVAALGGGSLVALGVAAVVVGRRRPG